MSQCHSQGIRFPNLKNTMLTGFGNWMPRATTAFHFVPLRNVTAGGECDIRFVNNS